jgi:DNA polymerase V
MRLRYKVKIYRPDLKAGVTVPLYLSRVHAGFPFPADDYTDQELDVAKHPLKNPLTTFIVYTDDDSMTGEGTYMKAPSPTKEAFTAHIAS